MDQREVMYSVQQTLRETLDPATIDSMWLMTAIVHAQGPLTQSTHLGHDIEFVEQQRVGRGQVLHPEGLFIGQEGVGPGRLGLLLLLGSFRAAV